MLCGEPAVAAGVLVEHLHDPLSHGIQLRLIHQISALPAAGIGQGIELVGQLVRRQPGIRVPLPPVQDENEGDRRATVPTSAAAIQRIMSVPGRCA